MNYQQRLIAAAKFIYSADDLRAGDDPPVNPADLGITANLKPHQIEGFSWLIKRYLLGVNVILGDEGHVIPTALEDLQKIVIYGSCVNLGVLCLYGKPFMTKKD